MVTKYQHCVRNNYDMIKVAYTYLFLPLYIIKCDFERYPHISIAKRLKWSKTSAEWLWRHRRIGFTGFLFSGVSFLPLNSTYKSILFVFPFYNFNRFCKINTSGTFPRLLLPNRDGDRYFESKIIYIWVYIDSLETSYWI